MTTPNGKTLPWTQRDGVKIGHLVAEPVDHEFAPGLRGIVWGYNGGTPGPTLEAVEGDRLRIYVTNRLPEPTTVHWHGLIIPNGMDGVAGLNQKPIPPGETWVYEFTVKHPGTYMYHSHYDEMVQIALGLKGMFVVHPKRPRGPRVDRDFVLMTHECKLDVGAKRPDPSSMNDFNLLTFNGRAFPGERAKAARETHSRLHVLPDAALDAQLELGSDAVVAGEIVRPERVAVGQEALTVVVTVQPLRVDAAVQIEVYELRLRAVGEEGRRGQGSCHGQSHG